MSEYYSRKGEPMTVAEWSASWPGRKDEKRVAATTLPDGKWVSTVWLGFDHSFGSGPPLIFETMVFPSSGNMSELDTERYSTESEAIAGHAAMVEKWSKPQDKQC